MLFANLPSTYRVTSCSKASIRALYDEECVLADRPQRNRCAEGRKTAPLRSPGKRQSVTSRSDLCPIVEQLVTYVHLSFRGTEATHVKLWPFRKNAPTRSITWLWGTRTRAVRAIRVMVEYLSDKRNYPPSRATALVGRFGKSFFGSLTLI